jgi:hypothetical protein
LWLGQVLVEVLSMDPAEAFGEGVAHARWRVQFIRSLIEMNRGISFHSPKREDTEASLLVKLTEAEQKLARLMVVNPPASAP